MPERLAYRGNDLVGSWLQGIQSMLCTWGYHHGRRNVWWRMVHLKAEESRERRRHWGLGVTFQGTSPSDLFPPARPPCFSISKMAPPCGGQAFNTRACQGDFIFNCNTSLPCGWMKSGGWFRVIMVSLLSGGSQETLGGCLSSLSLVL